MAQDLEPLNKSRSIPISGIFYRKCQDKMMFQRARLLSFRYQDIQKVAPIRTGMP